MAQLPKLFEAKEKTAVFTYGRNNPPTVGHEKLFDKTSEVAKVHGVKPHIFTSHSTDNTRNPLTPEHKVKLIKHAYPNAHVAASSKEMPSVIQIAKHLHNQGHQHLVMVAGSDRVDEYQKLLNKYNGHPDHYNFKTIRVVSAGHRDPDAPGPEGMSGTKLRSHAAAGNKEAFKSGLMSKLSDEHKEEVYNKVRESMSTKEEYEYEWGTPEGTLHMKKMTPGETTTSKITNDAKIPAIFKHFTTSNIISHINQTNNDILYAGAKRYPKLYHFLEFVENSTNDKHSFSEEELDSIANNLTWEDIVDLYDEEELDFEENNIVETLSPQARIKKRQIFARNKSRRNVAKNIKLKRSSDLSTLQKRAKLAARRALYNRFLQGRNKSDLSASEKDRIEKQVSSLKSIQSMLSQKFLPKIRNIERQRITKLS